jgi:hypothetical protein
MMIVQKQNLKELVKLTLLNILSVKGVLYTHYKNKQKQKGRNNEKNDTELGTELYEYIRNSLEDKSVVFHKNENEYFGFVEREVA